MALGIAGLCLPPRSRSDALLWGWIGGGLLYAYLVVTVERVDYYLYILLPLLALGAGNLVAQLVEHFDTSTRTRIALATAGAIVWLSAAYTGYREIAPYYHWNHAN